MTDALNITEADLDGLAEAAALELSMARRFAELAKAAGDIETAARMAAESARCLKGWRQSVRLHARLLRASARARAARRPIPRLTPSGHAVH